MTNKNNSSFRERFTEIGKGLKHEKPERPVLPSTEGLRLDTSFDISQFEGFAEPQAEIEGIADKVKPTGMGDLRIDADLGKLDEGIQKIQKQKINEKIRRLIEEAQKLIIKKQFRRAITPLDKALEVDHTSVEALYLKGYCHFGLKNYDTAIIILNDARKYARDREMIVLILVLQAACTRAIIEAFEIKLGALIKKKRFKEALALVERELQDQPSNVAFLYHKCDVLFLMGRKSQAKQVALDAMNRVDRANATLFKGFIDYITVQENQRYLEAARIALRRGDPTQALKKLEPCRIALAGNEQYEAIHAYAKKKKPGGFLGSIFSRYKVVSLTDGIRQKLLQWLLTEELNAGVLAMNAGKFDNATVSFVAAAKIDNGCRIICFLHGLAIFNGFQQAFNKKEELPSIEHSIKSLETASELFACSSTDPVLGEQSANVRKLVDNYHSQLQELARERARREKEAKPVNELVKDYNALMDSLEYGRIGSISELERAESKFRNLHQRADKLCKHRNRDQGRDLLDQIIVAIDRNFKELNAIRGKVRKNQLVTDCVTSFNSMMKYFEINPVRTQSDLKKARGITINIFNKVADARAKHSPGSEAWRVLDKIEEALNNVKRQLYQ